MSKGNKHPGLTAESAVRLALGAFYNAVACHPEDASDLVGLWMLEISRKMEGDDEVGPHYREAITRWREEDNLRNAVLENAQVATSTGDLDNAETGGLENA